MDGFKSAYDALNAAQQRAVDAIDGPVMVVAGPGTGKTQVLALRIANILTKTDTPAHGILCLTFTRSGARAMQERLVRLIGARAREVVVSTFHSFAKDLVEAHYDLLDFDDVPELVTEEGEVALIDELLSEREWKHLRPRGDAAKYFSDLRALVSLMKRQRLSPGDFLSALEADIASLKNDPESISTRGERKGELKKEVEKKIEGLERTREVIEFYEAYEKLKRERRLMDYDDVLEHAVALVEASDEVRAELRENHLYILVDEHQDSSGVQNSFLSAVWKGTDKPNIFVVGDDRQLIYGFGGASLSYFEAFKTLFGKAERITLVENYRSTAPILALADDLLASSLTSEKLKSNKKGGDPVGLYEYSYPRDEIIAAGLHFKEAIAKGVVAEECALLVPKNRQVRSAVATLRQLGLPVRSAGSVSLFSLLETEMLVRALSIAANPFDAVALSRSLFDETSGVGAMNAHAFLRGVKPDELSVDTLKAHSGERGLFEGEDPIRRWGEKLASWVEYAAKESVAALIHRVATDLLIESAKDHDALMRRIEVARTMLHLAEGWQNRHTKEGLKEFLLYLTRLESYGHTIPVATLLGGQGITVSTLHGSKGLEYEHVWIAHMNESVLMAQKRNAFTLPESIQEKVEERNREVATREVYVAITRAKEKCIVSHARSSETGGELELAALLADVPQQHFEKKTAEETEAALVGIDPKVYVASAAAPESDAAKELTTIVAEHYADRKVSVTLLSSFYECPWKWYFRGLLQLPDVKSEYQLFGSAVHGAVESILNDELKPKEKEVGHAILSYLERSGIKEKGALAKLSREGTESVMSWAKHYLPHIAKDHSAERPLSYRDPQFPHLSIFGKVDLTERFPDGTMTVTDFKTGSAKTAGVIEKRDDEGRLSPHLRQLAMYSYLIKGGEKGKDVTTSRLLYIEENPKEKNALYSTHIGEEELGLLVRDIKDYDELVKTGKWMERPCQAKSYDGGECEYCKWAKEVYGK